MTLHLVVVKNVEKMPCSCLQCFDFRQTLGIIPEHWTCLFVHLSSKILNQENFSCLHVPYLQRDLIVTRWGDLKTLPCPHNYRYHFPYWRALSLISIIHPLKEQVIGNVCHSNIFKVTLNCADKMVKFYNSLGYSCEQGNANYMCIRLDK